MTVRTTVFVFALSLCALARPQWVVKDLGVLPGGNNSYGYKINDNGMVVGFSETSQGARGFAWTPAGGMVNLGRLRQDPSSFALGLNNSGHVVGYSGSGVMRTGFEWTQSGGMRDIGTYGSDPVSLAMSINSSGRIVGLSGDDATLKRAFSYTSTTGMSDIGNVPGRTSAYARGVNDFGQIVGHSVGNDSIAFSWTQASGMAVLSALNGGTTSTAYSVNANGAIAGWATNASGVKHAVVWNSYLGAPVIVDAGLASVTAGEALDINDHGKAVGFGVFGGQERAVLYDPTLGARRLDSMFGVAGSGWTFVRAQGINESGQIVGYGLMNGTNHAFVASPVPEPCSILAFFSGFALLSLRRKKARSN